MAESLQIKHWSFWSNYLHECYLHTIHRQGPFGLVSESIATCERQQKGNVTRMTKTISIYVHTVLKPDTCMEFTQKQYEQPWRLLDHWMGQGSSSSANVTFRVMAVSRRITMAHGQSINNLVYEISIIANPHPWWADKTTTPSSSLVAIYQIYNCWSRSINWLVAQTRKNYLCYAYYWPI